MKIKKITRAGEAVVKTVWEGPYEEVLAWQAEQWERDDLVEERNQVPLEPDQYPDGPDGRRFLVVDVPDKVSRKKDIYTTHGRCVCGAEEFVVGSLDCILCSTEPEPEPPEDFSKYQTPGRSAFTGRVAIQEKIDDRKRWKQIEDEAPPRTGAVIQAKFPSRFPDEDYAIADIVWTTRNVPAEFEGQWIFQKTGDPINQRFTEWRYRPTQLDTLRYMKD